MPPAQFIGLVQGANGANSSILTSRISKSGGVDASFDAGAASVQMIAGDGFLEFTNCTQNAYRAIGFSVDNPGVTRDEIDYAIYLRNDGLGVSFFANGVSLASTSTAYSPADVFRLERIGTTVRAYINGELKFTFPAPSTGALLIDCSLFNTVAAIDGIKLYDATTKTWPALTWQSVVNCNVVAGVAGQTRRMTFAAPAKMLAGDQLVAILASQGIEQISGTNKTWGFVNALTSATNVRGLAVYRGAVTDTEPSSYTFDLNVAHETVGALLVYRGLDNTVAWLGGSIIDFSAIAYSKPPTRTFTRASDLYVGATLIVNPGAVTASPLPGGTERAEFSQSVLGANTVRLELIDAQPSVVGDVQRTVTLSGSAAGVAASFALSGMPTTAPAVIAGAFGLPAGGY